jgi:hypothetical protein
MGLDVPPIVWRTPMVPVSEYCGKLFDESSETMVTDDAYQDRYVDSCIRVQRIAAAAEVALKWYTNGYWQYVNDSEGGDIWHAGLSGLGSDPCFWPPDGIAETTDRTWFIPEWLESMHELSLLGDPVHERLRYSFGPSSTDLLPPLLTQLNCVGLGLLSYAASLIGISDDRLEALAELSQSCGAAYLDSSRCVLSERPIKAQS